MFNSTSTLHLISRERRWRSLHIGQYVYVLTHYEPPEYDMFKILKINVSQKYITVQDCEFPERNLELVYFFTEKETDILT